MYTIKFIDEIPSTNVWAKENFATLKDKTVISADLQTKGHGQFERYWYSSNKNGGNCYITIVLKPKNLQNLDKLTQYASLKTGETLGTYGVNPIYKYPNDILIENKKISGILAETTFKGKNLLGVAVGIGVNLNLDKEELSFIDIPATSIYFETGKKTDKIEFIKCLSDNFFNGYDEFIEKKITNAILHYGK